MTLFTDGITIMPLLVGLPVLLEWPEQGRSHLLQEGFKHG